MSNSPGGLSFGVVALCPYGRLGHMGGAWLVWVLRSAGACAARRGKTLCGCSRGAVQVGYEDYAYRCAESNLQLGCNFACVRQRHRDSGLRWVFKGR